ncbi:SIMPL domain-containing protein [Vibrio sp. CAU 1672]|uniref:SIMPL domain-containing protein n=1 Tax=Vibrio sp. CAU 1672 TaxID=3032594 RepID=UPI0023DCD3A6|nr:SIMPL domain-containing protein [Vibrio sp. CAU 1672]MDF2153260.1 SIMPL domain-containing protein [Vibrio sp. CAU 1672]
MKGVSNKSAIWLGLSVIIGLGMLGFFIQQTAIQYKAYERVVTVKGLSEREYPADTVIWPIKFTVASNDMSAMFDQIDQQTELIMSFLADHGINRSRVSLSSPSVIDRKAQQYGGERDAEFRYLASQTLTVYSTEVEVVRMAINSIGQLGKQGVVFNQDPYENRIEYSFTQLNDVKPEMIEEATKNARQVALKFAKDSQSSLGKIKQASQGQFSISSRDSNTPQIKKVRVVSTVQYYLSD